MKMCILGKGQAWQRGGSQSAKSILQADPCAGTLAGGKECGCDNFTRWDKVFEEE